MNKAEKKELGRIIFNIEWLKEHLEDNQPYSKGNAARISVYKSEI